MEAVVKSSYINLTKKEYIALKTAMAAYTPAVDSDFSTTDGYSKLTKKAASYVSWSTLNGSDIPVPAMVVTVWYNALNFWCDTYCDDAAEYYIAAGLACDLAKYADLVTAADAWYAAGLDA